MKSEIEAYLREIQATHIEQFKNKAEEIELFRIKYLGKKGTISALFEQFKALPKDQKKETGALLNQLKNAAQAKIEEFRSFVEDNRTKDDDIDLSLPADFSSVGSRHVLSVVMNEIIEIFLSCFITLLFFLFSLFFSTRC